MQDQSSKKIEAGALYTAAEVARCGFCSEAKLKKDRQKGAGPPYIRIGRKVLYQGDDLIAHLNACKVIPQSNT